jgi:hypothetical protein
MRTRSRMFLAVTFFLATGAPAAHAFDLTGHWTGKWSCKGVANDGKFTVSSSISPSTLDITQVGGTFAAVVDVSVSPADGGDFPFNVFAIPDLKKPDEKGEVVLLACPNGNTVPASGSAETMRGQVKTKANTAKASFKATSIFTDIFNGAPEVGTCKYSYKRIDTTDPGLTNCP